MLIISSFVIARIKRQTFIGQVPLTLKEASEIGPMMHTLTTFFPLLTVIFQMYMLSLSLVATTISPAVRNT